MKRKLGYLSILVILGCAGTGLEIRAQLSTDAVFVSNKDGNLEIYKYNHGSLATERLTNNAANDFDPAFSSIGEQVLFVSDRDGNQEIYSMNKSGTGTTRLTNNAAPDTLPQFYSNDTRIIWVRLVGAVTRIFVAKADGTSALMLFAPAAGVSCTEPMVNRQGTKLAYIQGDGVSDDLYVCNLDGTNPVRLTSTTGRETSPCWSPDGSEIAFAYSVPGSGETIEAIRSDGTLRRVIVSDTAGGENGWPCWTADGSRIIYSQTSGSGFGDLMWVPPLGGAPQTFVSGSASNPSVP